MKTIEVIKILKHVFNNNLDLNVFASTSGLDVISHTNGIFNRTIRLGAGRKNRATAKKIKIGLYEAAQIIKKENFICIY